jgi:tight adherence protein B
VTGWSVAACLCLAAVVVAWPAPRATRWRLRRVQPASGRRTAGRFLRLVRHRFRVRAAARAVTGRRSFQGGRSALPWVVVAAVAVLAGALGGPVAAVVTGGYGAAAVRAIARHAARRARITRRRELLDHLSSAAADLRAGLPVTVALAPTGASAVVGAPVLAAGAGPRLRGPDAVDRPLVGRMRAAVALADRTGAPLADLLERIEADARAADRVGTAVAAQAAGFQATAWLLAGLPVAGLALGYAIGADPLPVLLHTPVGATCAVAAVGLQLAGLGWTRRLMRAAGAGP